MEKLDIFIKRLNKIGITIELSGNYPWIYLCKINNIRVTETFLANHGFTIMFTPVRLGESSKFTDIKEIFKLIRLYTNNDKRN